MCIDEYRIIRLANHRGDCTVSFWGRLGRQRTMLLRHRGIVATAGAAAVVVVVGGTFAAVSSSPRTSSETLASVGNSSTPTRAKKAPSAKPMHVVSVTPSADSDGVNGAGQITVTFSSDLLPSTPLPSLSPQIPGSWQVSGRTATFTPQVGYMANTSVKLKIPGGTANGVHGVADSLLMKTETVSFTTGSFSTLRLQELLTQLGYLPFTWTPSDPATGQISASDANAQLAAAYNAPAGAFTWKSGYPSALTSQWQAGTDNVLVDGAVRAFEYNQGLAMDGDAGPEVWSHLLNAVAKDETNPNGYTYVYVQQSASDDEYLDLYHDGKLAITTPANTGIAQSPTADGTFPVYLRYQVTQMQGNNPNGTPYNDTVYWVSYFNGGDAVHAFPRGSYGWYQSLGCVELPYNGSGPGVAENVWNLISYGTLVTVSGPVA
jgi:peptidoglycan hydrolase-like protein with peptidoglycan-binding domain